MTDMYRLKQIPTEAQIRTYLRRIAFGKNVYCPACHSSHVLRYEERYRCQRCRIKFSLLSHTWLRHSRLSYQEFWLFLWCWTTQIPVRQARALTKHSEKAVRHWYELFRCQLPAEQDVLEHLVQLDEAYFGGKQGRTLFLGKQVGTRKLSFQILPHTAPAREEAWRFLQAYIEPQSTIHTDGAGIYHGIDRWWPVIHRSEIHRKWEFELTSEIEGIFGVLRTFIRRMYHHVTMERLPGLIGEFCYRFSHPELFENPRYYLEKTLRLVPLG